MIAVSTDFVAGHRIVETLGLARGSTIRAKHIGKDILAALRGLVGGEIKEYTEMLIEARNESLRRMEVHAEKLGANAVINVRFVTASVMAGAAELLVYGTAVKLEPEDGAPL
ncbi:MAG TPA: YbjQ family protein [Sumerlaeia bacterium]|nr:YbjQ family protein [Sumerlaeia bacterium]